MKLKNLLLTLVVLTAKIAFGQNAALQGRVLDNQSKAPLVGAIVHIDDTAIRTTTDANGNYKITNISPGKYKLKVKYIGYYEYEKSIVLAAGQTLNLDIVLKESNRELQAVSVHSKLDNETEAAARSNEKNSSNIKNVISAQAIAKSPDINAANVLQRVSGVTIQRNAGGDDAYAIVRGLEPRYNNTLINGVKIASPDSKSRLISLSVVPSELLARIEVNKTLLPEMEGDAIGGTVNMVFKDAPDKREFTATGAMGYSQIFIDRKFINFSKTDINKYSPSELNGPNYVAQPSDFTRSNLDFKSVNPPPTGTFSLSYGQRFFKNKLGFEIGEAFQNLYFGSDDEGNNSNADPNDLEDHRPRILDIINRSFSTQQTLNNFITHFDYRINDKNKLQFDNVLLYSKLEEAAISSDTSLVGGNGGRTAPGTGPVAKVYQSTNTQQLIETMKLSGNHILNKHFLFDWTGVFSDAAVRNPDHAQINTNILISYDPSTKQFSTTPSYFDNINRTWQHNEDKDLSGAGNLTYNTLIGKTHLELKAGGMYRHKTKYNYQDDYILRPQPTTNGGGKPVFTDIYSAQWLVYTPYGAGTYNQNNYNFNEDVSACFAEFKLSFPRLDISGGARSEITSQLLTIISDPTNANGVTKNYTDLLPSLQLKYKLTEKANLRAAYFASIARPAFYDLVPNSPPGEGGTAYQGNPHLNHTTADNFDIRYEYFPKDEEQILIGVYYKHLIHPIEYGYQRNSVDIIYTPFNSDEAKVAGLELAYTKYLGNFGLSGNYAYNYSNVTQLKIDRNNPSAGPSVYEQRMLTGAAVHDLNASLLYRNKKHQINAQLAYQYLGKTLVFVYPDNGDNYIQQPMSFLAASADIGIGKHFTVFTKLNNLLNTHTKIVLYNFTNGNLVTKATYLLGARYNL